VTATTSPVVLGTLTLAAGDDPETAWSDVRDLGRSGGLAPLPAARLAVAVATLAGRRDPTVVEIAQVDEASGRSVMATIHGGNASSVSAPPGLVDTSRRCISAGTVTWELTSKVTDDAMTSAPAWAALNVAAAHSQDSQELLIAVLAAVARQASRAEDLDSEVQALRRELHESSQGLLALHAELSDQHDEVERARVTAEQATRDKADFLANMSHEIRSPLNAVTGFTGLLRATDLTSEQAGYAEAVEAAGQHLLGVIDDILDLSKIESGFLELEAVPFDLFACVEDAIDMLAGRATEKNLILAALFAADIPARIVGDSLRLRQILVNLLSNAVKFTTEGHVVVEVTQQSAAGNPHELAFHVRDTGSGIPADRVERLFAPYTQADASTARSHGGTGLGLTICRQLAEQMGGEIVVDSTVGAGSTFTCTIRARAGLAPESGGAAPALCGAQVLVVNEQALYAESIGRHLASWGAELVTASSVDGAVSRSGDWPRVALAIVDASRPATFGHDIARLTTAAATTALPIICVAPMASRAALARLGEPGPFVRTPIRRDHLRQAVLAALGQGAEPPRAAQATDVIPAAAPPSTRRVLYVDDNPMLTALVERIFAADPAVTVHTAPDGRTGLELATQLQPDIVLLDLNLTDMSGEALLRQLRADSRTRSIPVVIVSGDTAPGTIGRLADLGVAGYLTKPFAAAQLSELVSSIAGPGA
jgi:signal transduction histidine kinase/DNA-binding response OmpR family regulator